MKRVSALVLGLALVVWAVGCESSGGGTGGGEDIINGSDSVTPPEDTGGGDPDLYTPPEDTGGGDPDIYTPPEDTGGGGEDIVTPPEDTGEPTKTEFELLVEYLEGDNGNFINTAAPKIVAVGDVIAALEDYDAIIDLRTGDKYGPDGAGNWAMVPNGTPDFEDGHIEGSVMVALADVLTYVEANLSVDDKILVVCWSGQNSGHAVVALNLLGYDAWSLKFGLAAWNADFDVWTGKLSTDYDGMFVTDADTGKNAPGDYPMITTGEATAEAILRARIDALLANPPRVVEPTVALASLEDYYLVNYWPENHYLSMGHFADAHQYTPKASLHTGAELATLPADEPILVYCYTGQNSSQVAAYLRILGYDAWGLLWGTNALIYDNMTAQQWTGAGDFAYVAE